MKKISVMLDVETLGVRPGSVLLSIGAVKFDREKVTDTFYVTIGAKSCTDVGLTIDPDTVMWWMGQSEEARRALLYPEKTIRGALMDFTNWVTGFDGMSSETNPDDIELWGNGANFDNVLLAAAYDACGLDRPWKFYNDRCYRTLKALHPDVPMARSGTHHNALDDARSQALHLITLPSFQAMCDREEEAVCG